MRRTLWIPCLMLLACASPIAQQSTTTADPVERLAALAWLTGTWVGPSPLGTWESSYTSASGGLMLSVSKEFKDGKVVSFEFEQFMVDGDDVVMQPYVRGAKSPVTFRMTASDPSARRAVFENPEHDFPQILTYHRTSEETLSIKAQARKDGKLTGFELILTRQD